MLPLPWLAPFVWASCAYGDFSYFLQVASMYRRQGCKSRSSLPACDRSRSDAVLSFLPPRHILALTIELALADNLLETIYSAISVSPSRKRPHAADVEAFSGRLRVRPYGAHPLTAPYGPMTRVRKRLQDIPGPTPLWGGVFGGGVFAIALNPLSPFMQVVVSLCALSDTDDVV